MSTAPAPVPIAPAQDETAVRADSLPAYNPTAAYPMEGIVGRIINYAGASDSYQDPRGPVFFDVKPLPNVPLETGRLIAYNKEMAQARTNEDGLAYSAYNQLRDASGFSVMPAGTGTKVVPQETSFVTE